MYRYKYRLVSDTVLNRRIIMITVLAVMILASSYAIASIGNKLQQVMAQKQQITVTKKEPNETWITYQNSTLGVKIQYPSDWIKTEGRNVNNLVKFFPPEIKSGRIHAFIQVRILNIVPTFMQNKTSLEGYTQKELSQLRKSFTIMDSYASTITANHIPAHTVLYGAEDFKGMKIWTIKDSHIYLITYAAITEKYPLYLPIAQKMVNSFNIIK